jgi:murein DD-endopeptidase MepM/ murein hydrolase activator NlpD
MSKDRRFYTFLIATSSARVKRVNLHRSIIYSSGTLISLVVLLALVGALKLVRSEALSLRYFSVKAENERLKKENESYQNSYERLKGQINYIEDTSRELARRAKMESLPEIDNKVGTGGPETVAALDKAADALEQGVRQIGDRLRADLLRLASIPSGLPVSGYITDGYGVRRNPFSGEGREFHEGLDIAVEFGTPVQTTADGLVIWAAPHAGYGNCVVVYHNNGITTRYGHLSKITVDTGQRVRRGDRIGHAGSTGRSTGPHVHYEIRENDQPIDPQRYAAQGRP